MTVHPFPVSHRQPLSEPDAGPAVRLDQAPGPRILLGLLSVDGHLRGGLARGALHEVLPALGADALAAAGFALGLALRAGGDGPVLWVRDNFAAAETGRLDGSGLAELGALPARLILVQVGRSGDALWAADAAARCAALGAVLLETGGGPRALDLTATRRLALALRASGTTMILLRGGPPAPSAATTRWRVVAAPSRAMEANAPGHPAFTATLVRHRGGIAERTWQMEWDRDRQRFTEVAFAERSPLSGAVVSSPSDGPAAPRGMDPGGPGARRRAE